MKKKLIVIGIVILVVLAFVMSFPLITNININNKKYNLTNTDEEIMKSSYESIIAQYQNVLDYPSSMINLLNIEVGLGQGLYCSYQRGECDFYYAYYDLNDDGYDELVVRASDNTGSTEGIVDIFYYDKFNGVKSISPGGFWNRNFVTLYNGGKFSVHGSSGADDNSITYYGNVASPKDKVDTWTYFGRIFKYKSYIGTQEYLIYDEQGNTKDISKSKYDTLVESFSQKLDYSNWNWKKLVKNTNVVIDDKYKVTDYIYLSDKDIFVKGTFEGTALQVNYTAFELKMSYPELYKLVSKMATDITTCMNTNRNSCITSVKDYNYPMKYMEETNQLDAPYEWHFVVSTPIKIYYDSDNDGYVDSSSSENYLIGPIDEYEERFGKLAKKE